MTHKKELWAVLIVVSVGAFFLVLAAARAIGQVIALQNANNNAVDTSSWQTYHNAQFGFSVEYPSNWQIFTSGLSANVPFIALGNPLNGQTTYTMEILMEQNPQSLTSGDYVHQVLVADRAQDEANAKSAPAPTLTPQFKSSYITAANGLDAYELFDVFEFDHNAEQIYVANGAITLHFDFPVADANPNIASPANNNAIAHLILGTLTLQ